MNATATKLAREGTAKRAAQDEKANAIAKLREWLPPGSTVYTVLRHTSASGMSRCISVFVMDKETGHPREVDYFAARALGLKTNNDRGWLIIGGCGMDMGFHIVTNLSYTLHPDGFGCVGEGCPSNDHSNSDRDYTPHGHRGPRYVPGDRETLRHWHTPGYSLRHRWL